MLRHEGGLDLATLKTYFNTVAGWKTSQWPPLPAPNYATFPSLSDVPKEKEAINHREKATAIPGEEASELLPRNIPYE